LHILKTEKIRFTRHLEYENGLTKRTLPKYSSLLVEEQPTDTASTFGKVATLAANFWHCLTSFAGFSTEQNNILVILFPAMGFAHHVRSISKILFVFSNTNLARPFEETPCYFA